MRSFSSLPGLKYGTFFGGTSTLSPVFGLRPFRGSRLRRRKLPNPRSSIFSPRCSASMMLWKTVSTMTSECFFVRSETRETSSTSSALVIRVISGTGDQGSGIRERGQGRQGAGLMAAGWSLGETGPRAPIPDPFTLFIELKVLAERGPAFALRRRVVRPVRPEFGRLERADAQPDLAIGRAQLDDLHRRRLPDFEVQLLCTFGIVELA